MALYLFLVSTHLYSTTLYELSNYLSVRELEQATDTHRYVAEQTSIARNHIEYVTERIGEGRKRWPIPMSAQDFRRAMGTYSASAVTFGAESFDLGAIRAIGRHLASRLRDLLELTRLSYYERFRTTFICDVSTGTGTKK